MNAINYKIKLLDLKKKMRGKANVRTVLQHCPSIGEKNRVISHMYIHYIQYIGEIND